MRKRQAKKNERKIKGPAFEREILRLLGGSVDMTLRIRSSGGTIEEARSLVDIAYKIRRKDVASEHFNHLGESFGLKSILAVPGALLVGKAKRPEPTVHEERAFLMTEDQVGDKVVNLGRDIPQYVRVETTVSGADSTASFTVKVTDMDGSTLDVFKGCAEC